MQNKNILSPDEATQEMVEIEAHNFLLSLEPHVTFQDEYLAVNPGHKSEVERLLTDPLYAEFGLSLMEYQPQSGEAQLVIAWQDLPVAFAEGIDTDENVAMLMAYHSF